MCYRLITLLLLCVLVFAGCRSEDPAPEPSPAALARSVQAEEDSALYLGLIRRLDFQVSKGMNIKTIENNWSTVIKGQ